MPLTAQTTRYADGDGGGWETQTSQPGQVWWLLAPNPFVILADAAPKLPPPKPHHGQPMDPLGMIGRQVRDLRGGTISSDVAAGTYDPAAVWPYGLAFDLLLGAGGFWVTTRRLRTPVDDLPSGIRVA